MFYPKRIIEKILFFVVFTIIFLGVYYSQTDLKFFEGTYVREDGPIEWLTVLALFLCTLLSLYRVKILKPFRNKSFIFGLYGFAALFFFGMMEEISWGQRIWEQFFDFRVPEFFQTYNTQREMNFHNLKFGETKINKLIFGTFLGIVIVIYFLILPFLYQKKESIKALINKYALPIPNYYHIIAYLILAVSAELIAGGKKGEILEFGGCWIVFLMIYAPLNRVMFSRRSFER